METRWRRAKTSPRGGETSFSSSPGLPFVARAPSKLSEQVSAMSLSIRLLGPAASRPTIERNVASLAVHREGETLMFDCGEGTQRQMMRWGVSFALADIFFTHLHADHILGVIGLIRTMALQGREETLRLWGPRGSSKVLRRAEALGFERSTFPVEIMELDAETEVKRDGYRIVPFAVDHRGAASIGFSIIEETRKGRFDPDKARAL